MAAVDKTCPGFEVSQVKRFPVVPGRGGLMTKSPNMLTASERRNAQKSIANSLVEFGELRSRLRRDVENGDAEAADRTALAMAVLSETITMTEVAVRAGLVEHLRSHSVFDEC